MTQQAAEPWAGCELSGVSSCAPGERSILNARTSEGSDSHAANSSVPALLAQRYVGLSPAGVALPSLSGVSAPSAPMEYAVIPSPAVPKRNGVLAVSAPEQEQELVPGRSRSQASGVGQSGIRGGVGTTHSSRRRGCRRARRHRQQC